MAGQPKKRAMITELERRTREEFGVGGPETHADYAAHWLENGGTVVSLAASIGGALGMQVMRASLDKYLREIDAEWESTGRRARARGSFAMVEEATELAVKEHDKDAVPGVKLAVDTRLKVAAMFNRDEFGERKQLNVSISLPHQHLDALRRRSLPHASVALAPVATPVEAEYTVESTPQVVE